MKHARSFLILTLAFLAQACTAQINSAIGNAPGVTTPAPTYTCAYYSGYDDLGSCQTSSHANCTSTYETFPTGGIGLCFFPVPGYEACQVSPQTWDWIYTSYGDWCDTGTSGGSGEIYQQSRSVITCSSVLCHCENTQSLTRTCSGSGDCASYSPNALTVSPTPAPCP